MNLAIFRANGDFSQSSLSIFGYPEASREAGNLGTAMLSERLLQRQKARVQQPPKMRKTFGGPANFRGRGKIDLSEKIARFINQSA